jgi:hypothetical protein
VVALVGAASGASPLAAPAQGGTGVSGVVFADRNGNGVRDGGEPGVAGVAVSDQAEVVATGADGSFRLAGRPHGVVFVSVPDGYRSVGPFWRTVGPADSSSAPIAFALRAAPAAGEFTFVHASDTHASEASLPRLVRLRALVDSLRPAFVLITGDLVRDALRVPEAEARGYYELFEGEARRFTSPVWTVPGNHEIFGIERHRSLVPPTHPLYERGMYRRYRGPDYYSFTHGGVHFVGLNTIGVDDLWYYGQVDSVQLAWLERDLALVPPTMPVVTFNHIPFFGTGEIWNGYTDEPPAPTTIRVRGRTVFRHVVSNAADVLARLKGRRLEIALGGHYHMRESIAYEIEGMRGRFHQAAAVVGPTRTGGVTHRSGITLYRVRAGAIDDGTFIAIDPVR